MANLAIVQPLTIAAITSAAGANASDPGGPAVNLLTPDPREAFAQGGGGIVTIDADLPAAAMVDTFYLGYVGNAPAISVTISGGAASRFSTTYGSNVRMAPSAVVDPVFQHVILTLTAPVSTRLLRFEVDSGTAGTMTIGNIVVGQRFTPTYNYEYGAGRGIEDTGTVERLLSGAFGINEGVTVGSFGCTLGDLTDAETQQLYRLSRGRGNTRSILVVEDPDNTTGLNERIHWGLFGRFDPYERFAPGATRWSLRVDDWA